MTEQQGLPEEPDDDEDIETGTDEDPGDDEEGVGEPVKNDEVPE